MTEEHAELVEATNELSAEVRTMLLLLVVVVAVAVVVMVVVVMMLVLVAALTPDIYMSRWSLGGAKPVVARSALRWRRSSCRRRTRNTSRRAPRWSTATRRYVHCIWIFAVNSLSNLGY